MNGSDSRKLARLGQTGGAAPARPDSGQLQFGRRPRPRARSRSMKTLQCRRHNSICRTWGPAPSTFSAIESHAPSIRAFLTFEM
jgi:hypothetical protein